MAEQKQKRKRWKPYVYVTWITGLLSGEQKCEWASWYRAHFMNYPKIVDEQHESSLDAWKEEHDRLVQATGAAFKTGTPSTLVTYEDENMFRYESVKSGITLAGKPDLVVVSERDVNIVDGKTGKAKDADMWQVRIYGYAWVDLLSLAPGDKLHIGIARPKAYSGYVTSTHPYSGYVTSTHPYIAEVTPAVKAKIRTVIQTVGGELEPAHTPSPEECAFCDLAECTKRIARPGAQHVAVGDAF